MSAYKEVKPDDFLDRISQNPNAVIIDVRSSKDYDKDHLPGALNILFTEKEKFSTLDKNKSYYLYCRVGGKSAMIAYFMTQNGYENAFCIKSTFKELQKTYSLKF